MRARSLRKILAPNSIAVIGASDEPSKVGAVTLANLRHAGFAGRIFPVNSRRQTVQGLTAFASVGSLPEPVDLAIICTPAATVPDLVRQCGECGVGGLIILTAGFQEVGSAGRSLDAALRAELRRFPRMRVIGPNCLGVMVPQSRLNASFAATMPSPGRVAFVSQSGALCTAMLDWASEQSLGFSHFVSVGNMLDVDLADLLDYLAEDEQTDAVILYIESITHARRFMSAASACARRKPIVAYKAGRFPQSAQAAASHTGAMAGVDSVYEAALERAGIVRVFDVDDLFDCAQLLAHGPRVLGDRLAIVTNAGGPGVMACDALLGSNGKLAKLSEATVRELDDVLPSAWSHGNPVDILGDATPDRFNQALRIVCADDQVDAVLAILTPQAMTDPTAMASALVQVAEHGQKPILASWMGGTSVRQGIHVLQQAGVPTAPSPNEAISAFMDLVRYGRNLKLLYETPHEVPLTIAGRDPSTRRSLRTLFASGRDLLYESEAKTLLSAYGIPVAEVREAHSADEAVALAESIGFPVVIKVVSPRITHKTDVGGVMLNLANAAQLREAYDTMMANVQRARPDAEILAVSVQPMISLPGGIEFIIGAKKDPVFGPVIMVGVGGIAAELFQDRALGLPPLNERLALHMLESLRAWPLLKGFRGRKPVAHLDCLVETLLRFSALVADFPEISELDANPVLARDNQIIALDARVVVDHAAVEHPAVTPFAHLAICPYPEDWIERAELSDGTTITLRPIKPEDEPCWLELLARCASDGTGDRFRHRLHVDSDGAGMRFCFVDYDREWTVVAEGDVDGRKALLGVARMLDGENESPGDCVTLVDPKWQAAGVGQLLTRYCADHARRGQLADERAG